jgi:hypothetical protein
MPTATVVVPSKGTEPFFKRTVEGLLETSTSGSLGVWAVTDGYVAPREDRVHDDRVTYLSLEPSASNQKRQAINYAIAQSSGEFVASCDAHVVMSEGWDSVLIRDHKEDNWVQVPERRRLDPFEWKEQIQYNKPHIRSEYWMWQGVTDKVRPALHGYRWDERSREMEGVPLFETPTMQASFWWMKRSWFQYCGFMDMRYTGWGQEAESIALGGAYNGGKLLSNTSCNFSHWHKGQAGRQYHLCRSEVNQSYKYSFDLWVIERKDFFIEYVSRFPPFPNWSSDWVEKLYGGNQ